MKKFQIGKTYTVNGGGVVTVEKKTDAYITISGAYSGRYKLRAYGDSGLFALGEHIIIPGPHGIKYFCFAEKEIG